MYGVCIPKSVQEAYAINQAEGKNLWQKVIKEEMPNVQVAFEAYDDNSSKLICYDQITTHKLMLI